MKRSVATSVAVSLSFTLLVACVPTPEPTAVGPSGPCSFTARADLAVYRLPDSTSDIFGTLPTGETHEVLAQTADGWLGFDPGIAQAGNIGLAHHRWVFNYVEVSPSCLSSVDLVTLEQVMADLEASG